MQSYIKLLKPFKIGNKKTTKIYNHRSNPSTLLTLLETLPDEERNAKKLISEAICYGYYTVPKDAIKLIPPVNLEDELITHIYPLEITNRTLYDILQIYRDNKVNNELTKNLEAL